MERNLTIRMFMSLFVLVELIYEVGNLIKIVSNK